MNKGGLVRDDYYSTCKTTVPAPDRSPHLETESSGPEVSKQDLTSIIWLQRGQVPSGMGEGRNDLKNPSAFEVLVAIKREESTAGRSRKCQDSWLTGVDSQVQLPQEWNYLSPISSLFSFVRLPDSLKRKINMKYYLFKCSPLWECS